MLTRVVVPIVVTVLVGIGTIQMWRALQQNEIGQVERIVTLESWSTRSHLARSMATFYDALRNLGEFWGAISQLPAEQWPAGEHMELDGYDGVRLVLYESQPDGVRFMHSPDRPGYSYQPETAEWAAHAALAARMREQDQSTVLGPITYPEGGQYLEIYEVERDGERIRRMAVMVDIEDLVGQMLVDEAPSYAISVFWDEHALFRGEDAATGLPPGWIKDGLIRMPWGSIWRVEHRPTTEAVRVLESRATDMILLMGLIIAVLMGFLTHESARARRRARNAEAAEREVAELNRNLEAVVQQRTRALADRTADLQTITDSVAHDMRNPLNAMSMNIQLLSTRLDRAGGHEAELAVIDRVYPCVTQMTTILDRLSGLSALSHETFERELLDMRALVEDVFDALTAVVPDRPVELVVDEDLPGVEADDLLVRMLVTNLLGNALKYTRDEPVARIHVSATSEDGVTVYTFADNGIGFDNDKADRLFAAFQRLDESERFEGSGLGLTIVARVVERHGGWIRGEGRPGEYAKFHFTLHPNA
ncbi:hypothetical protein F3N42_04175 [Marinihelvus fidelis]|uniref:histidine kinase n=1 Tax=Marinihelvus fidelis TaxID=2613842 RepID=A0A5N0TET1_9GAMM|nr:ATP-binding protein [Marinihelvus fidelis]KAA9133552.1 hypothetical protein F3N42_04175 [Marinihelvus fidelis]